MEAVDRISGLPDHILHQILFLLPLREAIATSVLSKSWYNVSTRFPISEFNESNFLPPNHSGKQQIRNMFVNFVGTSLRRQCLQNNCIPRFQLTMYLDDTVRPHIRYLLGLAIEYGVKELDLSFTNQNYDYPFKYLYYQDYILPQSILSSRELTYFRLHGNFIKLSWTNDTVNWPSLRELHLSLGNFDDKIFKSLTLGCPMIEKLSLSTASSLKIFQLSGFGRLKQVQVKSKYTYNGRMEIHLLSLRTLEFSCTTWSEGRFNVSGCKNLEVLKIRCPLVTDQLSQDLVSQLPQLKVLDLSSRRLTRVRISSPSLENLTLQAMYLVDATIDAPRLESFRHEINNLRSPVFVVGKSSLQKVSLKLPWNFSTKAFFRLGDYIRNFPQIKCLTLQVSTGFLHEKLNNTTPFPALLNVKQLELCTNSDWKRPLDLEDPDRHKKNFENLLHGLLCVIHPESLLLKTNSGYNREFMMVLCQKLRNEGNYKWCCIPGPLKCWQQGLKSLGIHEFSINANGEDITCAGLLEILSARTPQQICFALKW